VNNDQSVHSRSFHFSSVLKISFSNYPMTTAYSETSTFSSIRSTVSLVAIFDNMIVFNQKRHCCWLYACTSKQRCGSHESYKLMDTTSEDVHFKATDRDA